MICAICQKWGIQNFPSGPQASCIASPRNETGRPGNPTATWTFWHQDSLQQPHRDDKQPINSMAPPTHCGDLPTCLQKPPTYSVVLPIFPVCLPIMGLCLPALEFCPLIHRALPPSLRHHQLALELRLPALRAPPPDHASHPLRGSWAQSYNRESTKDGFLVG